MKKTIYIITILAIVGMIGLIIPSYITKAEETSKIITPDIYILDENNEDHEEWFKTYNNSVLSSDKTYTSIGTLNIRGSFSGEKTVDSINSYSVNDVVIFEFDYEGRYLEAENGYKICSDSKEEVYLKGIGNYDFEEDIDYGRIVVLKSYDNINWAIDGESHQNCFKKDKLGKKNIYSTSKDDVIKGTYYRIIILYELKEDKIYGDLLHYIEEYNFYICYAKNPVIIRNIMDRSDISNQTTTKYGFLIDRMGTNDSIHIIQNGVWNNVGEYASIHTAGNYKIEVSNKLGEKFSYAISVTEGLKFQSVNADIYENRSADGYYYANKVNKPVYGSTGITSLFIGNGNDGGITYDLSSTPIYGVRNSDAGIYIRLRYGRDLTGESWRLCDDPWGDKENEFVTSVRTGRVDSGAVIVQKSKDGRQWSTVSNSGKNLGTLYTTDFYNNYGCDNDVLLFTPTSSEIENGLYIKVIYAYKVYQEASDTSVQYIEKYDFYLCSDNLDTIAFRNMSTTAKTDSENVVFDGTVISASTGLEYADTLTDGASTFTGFKIDYMKNPIVKTEIYRDGEKISNFGVYDKTGKYDITLTSKTGTTKHLTLYVDTRTDEEITKLYFGEGLISDDERIWDNGNIPVFKGEVYYNINEIDSNTSPLKGLIRRTDGNWSVNIEGTRDQKYGRLDPGEYEAVFNSNITVDSERASGDNRKFTFRFRVVDSSYDSSPRINRDLLRQYSTKSVFDCYPRCYCLIYPTLKSGNNLILIFATYEAAREYCIEHEMSCISEQKDGSYRYSGNRAELKDRYEDNESVLKAVSEYADKAVQEVFMDFSDKYFMYTLSEETASKYKNDFSEIDLKYNDVFLFADETQRSILTSKLDELNARPLLNEKVYYEIISNGKTYEDPQKYPFIFIKTQYDSERVYVKDCNGVKYEIAYDMSVSEQLDKKDCPSGLVEIIEENKTGEISYSAAYLRRNDNTTVFTISYYDKNLGDMTEQSISQKNDSLTIDTDMFSLSDVHDDIDPGAHIKVTYGDAVEYYTMDADFDKTWTAPGDYVIQMINRLGYNYHINVRVYASEKVSIIIDDDYSGEKRELLRHKGDKNINLPLIYRKGYILEGYTDENGNDYIDKIEKLETDNTQLILSPKWKAKSVQIILVYGDEEESYTATYNDEFVIPDIKGKSNLPIIGWQDMKGNGVSEKILVNEEEKIVLTAVIKDLSNKQDDKDNSLAIDEETEDDSSSLLIIVKIIGIVMLIGVIVLVIVFFYRKLKVKNNNTSDDMNEIITKVEDKKD